MHQVYIRTLKVLLRTKN